MSTTMDNQEDILDALRDFEKKSPLEIPPVLEQYLGRVASTGETIFPWSSMKPLFVKKLDEVMQQFETETHMDSLPLSPNVENVKFDAMRRRILEAIDRFHGAPFTIQRLCELITEPKKHYKRADKFLRGIEKNILVVSTVDPFGRKIVSESKSLVNGLDSNGHTQQAEKSNQGERMLPCPKTSHEANWISNETTSSVALPTKELMQGSMDSDCELAAGEGPAIEKNIGSNPGKVEDHSCDSNAPGHFSGTRETTEPSESSSHPVPCLSNITQETQKWPNADSTQPCAKDSGDALVLPDSQEAVQKPPLAHSHNEEKLKDSHPQIHSEETMDRPFSKVPGSTEISDQTATEISWPSGNDNQETSDNHTVVSSTEQDSKPMEEVRKGEEPSSSKENEQAVTHSFSGALGGASSNGSEAQTSQETPEEGISSSESSGTPSPPGDSQESAEPVSASASQALPDSQAVTSEPQESNKTEVLDTASAQSDPAFSHLHEKRSESEIVSCDTTGPASSSSDNTGVAMETEDSEAVTTGSSSNKEENPPESSSSANALPSDEPMDQD